MTLAYSHSPFHTCLHQIARKPRTGTGKTRLFTTIRLFRTLVDNHIAMPPIVTATTKTPIMVIAIFSRQAVVIVRIQIRTQLVRGDLPIRSFSYLNNIISAHTTLATLYPAGNKRLPFAYFFSKSSLSTTNFNSF